MRTVAEPLSAGLIIKSGLFRRILRSFCSWVERLFFAGFVRGRESARWWSFSSSLVIRSGVCGGSQFDVNLNFFLVKAVPPAKKWAILILLPKRTVASLSFVLSILWGVGMNLRPLPRACFWDSDRVTLERLTMLLFVVGTAPLGGLDPSSSLN